MLVTSFVFLEELITKDGFFDKEIRRTIAMSKEDKSETGEGLGTVTPLYNAMVGVHDIKARYK